MKKQILAAITSNQLVEGADEQDISFVTCATLYRRQGKYYITYDESELTGLEDTHTTIKIDGKSVLVKRVGKYPSQLLFIEGERHFGVYQTEFGSMTISTYTAAVTNSIGDEGGILRLDYTTEIENMLIGANHFEMVVTQPNTEFNGEHNESN